MRAERSSEAVRTPDQIRRLLSDGNVRVHRVPVVIRSMIKEPAMHDCCHYVKADRRMKSIIPDLS